MKLYTIILIITSAMTGLSAQSLGSSSGKGNANQTEATRQEAPSFTALMESFGETLTNGLRETIGFEYADPDAWNSNQSPRETVFTFVNGMNEIQRSGSTDYERVNQTLPEHYTALSEQAEALKAVFNRIGDIPTIDLPGKMSVDSTGINRFEVFPYAVDHEWMWEHLGEAPVGKIVVIQQEGTDNWVFSEETMKNAPKLLESVRSISPILSNPNRDELVKRVFAPTMTNTPWWAWLVLAASITLAWYIGNFVRSNIIKLGNYCESKTKPIVGSMFRSIGTAIAIIIGTIVFVIGGSFIEFSPIVAKLHWDFIKIVMLIAAIWVIFGFTDLIAMVLRKHVISDRHEYGEMTVTIIQRIIHSFIFVLLTIFILENVLGFNIGALITGLGIIGLALSLAGKETAQNLFGAISIFINRPFVVGDWVEFKGNLGEVSDVRMQATHIRLLSGKMLVVPNMQFVSNEVENLAMRKYLRREMDITIPYNTAPEKVDQAIKILDEILRREEIVEEGKCNLEEKPPIISFSEFGDYYLNLKVYYWYFIGDSGEELQRNNKRGWFSYLDHCTLVNRAILHAFNENDIEFAFPTQTIDLEQGDRESSKNTQKENESSD